MNNRASASEAVGLQGPIAARRRIPVGAEVLSNGGVHFRVWAPRCGRVEVVFETGNGAPAREGFELERDEQGYFSATAAAASAGMLYRYRLDGGDQLIPDPASRFQPQGPHGPSQII